jgi:sugar phosphate isomerase/epimerase
MIEFSCHTWAFNDLTLQEALGTIARLGFRYADIGSGPHLNAVKAAADPRRVATEIISDLRVYNLKLADLYLMLPHIAEADADRRQREIDLFRTMLPLARAIGTPGITLSPGLAQPEPETDDPTDAEADHGEDEEAAEAPDAAPETPPIPDPYTRTRDSLREMVRLAGDLPVSIEPHIDSMAPTPEAALRLVNDVPGLMLTLDWAQMVYQDIRHDEIVALLPHARHIQMRQAARAQLQTPLARGRIKIDRVMQALEQAGYAGAICIEYMKTAGWHGIIEVNTIRETAALRDSLRNARDA